ncbi:CGNR zinc finger domain-containing protein [Actinophytocola glycyrrhizae]|uniref:CGNR zinc finger domain-containing protein n=1 Tax=Actinophytocola glycyrrhizae TaxID=2044873 RepID=A0ABV9S3E8_9PSEU
MFVDLSRNRSWRFCSPAVCGNRVHVAAHRARQAGSAVAASAAAAIRSGKGSRNPPQWTLCPPRTCPADEGRPAPR